MRDVVEPTLTRPERSDKRHETDFFLYLVEDPWDERDWWESVHKEVPPDEREWGPHTGWMMEWVGETGRRL